MFCFGKGLGFMEPCFGALVIFWGTFLRLWPFLIFWFLPIATLGKRKKGFYYEVERLPVVSKHRNKDLATPKNYYVVAILKTHEVIIFSPSWVPSFSPNELFLPVCVLPAFSPHIPSTYRCFLEAFERFKTTGESTASWRRVPAKNLLEKKKIHQQIIQSSPKNH